MPSFKLFMAYKGALMVDDATLLRTLKKAKQAGALISVHAENGDVVDVLVKEYLAAGKGDPEVPRAQPAARGRGRGHRPRHLPGRLADAPIYIVHLTCKDALDKVRAARDRGLPVYAETCPQYLALSIDNYDEPGFEGAKYVCSPPLRDRANWEELWAGIAAGDLQVVATDHCPFNFVGQKDLGRDDFSKIPNGAPGIEHRLLLLHTLGVQSGRIGMSKLVELFSTAPARFFGLFPAKGIVAPGSDADLVLFDAGAAGTITAAGQTQNIDYTPYEGMRVAGAVRTVLRRGEVIVDGGGCTAAAGSGRYLHRTAFLAGVRPPSMARGPAARSESRQHDRRPTACAAGSPGIEFPNPFLHRVGAAVADGRHGAPGARRRLGRSGHQDHRSGGRDQRPPPLRVLEREGPHPRHDQLRVDLGEGSGRVGRTRSRPSRRRSPTARWWPASWGRWSPRRGRCSPGPSRPRVPTPSN